jgi:glutamate 5-kinase
VEGGFDCGDIVGLVAGDSFAGPRLEPFARGLVNYTADEVRRIVGLKTERIAEVLGTFPYEEVVHRDNLSVIRREAGSVPAGGTEATP